MLTGAGISSVKPEDLEGWLRRRREAAAEAGVPPAPQLRRWIRWPRLLLGMGALGVCFVLSGLLGLQAHRERQGLAALTGVVVDSEGTPVEGALVFGVARLDRTAKTGKDGTFHLSDLPPGTQNFVVVRRAIGQEFRVRLLPNLLHDVGICRHEAPAYR